MIAYANAPEKTALEIHFIYLGNKKIYCIFNMLHNLCFIFHKMPFIS
jgi:hypothetical protein